MKKLAAAFLLTTAVSAQAQTGEFMIELPVYCGPNELILNQIKEDNGEALLFMGGGVNLEGDALYTTVFGNETTGTFTVVITNRSLQQSCVLSSGNAYQQYSGDPI